MAAKHRFNLPAAYAVGARARLSVVSGTTAVSVSRGITVPALLPVQRIAWPDEAKREAAVRNFLRVIEIAAIAVQPTRQSECSSTQMSAGATSLPTIPPKAKMIPSTSARRLRNQFCPSVCVGMIVENPMPMPPRIENPR